MRFSLFSFFLCICCSLTIHAERPPVASASKPNILFIFADDHAYDAIGAMGNDIIQTPHLDRLAAEGTVFNRAYNMGSFSPAVCIASRTMLNTGRFVWSTKGYKRPEKMWSTKIGEAGYHTYFTGKWHVLGITPGRVFETVGTEYPGMPKATGASYNRPQSPEDTAWQPWDTNQGGFWEGGKHWSEVTADETIAFIEQASTDDRPFFIYSSFNAPHDPRQSPQEYVDMYPIESIPLPKSYRDTYPEMCEIGLKKGKRLLRDENLAPYPRTDYAVRKHTQEYYAIVSHLDAQIGRILEALEASGQADNTIIIYTADHGLGHGRHSLLGKQNMYEHSLRAPFIMAGPGLASGHRIETPIYIQDITPTTLEIAGAEVPDHVHFKSLKPLIEDPTAKHYDVIYGDYKASQLAIIKDEHKLIYYPKAKVSKLFNISKDPEELDDLAGNPEYAPLLAKLTAELKSLRKEIKNKL